MKKKRNIIQKKFKCYLKHFRCTIDRPDSLYSSFDIHTLSNFTNKLRIDPQIHDSYEYIEEFSNGFDFCLVFITSQKKSFLKSSFSSFSILCL